MIRCLFRVWFWLNIGLPLVIVAAVAVIWFLAAVVSVLFGGGAR